MHQFLPDFISSQQHTSTPTTSSSSGSGNNNSSTGASTTTTGTASTTPYSSQYHHQSHQQHHHQPQQNASEHPHHPQQPSTTSSRRSSTSGSASASAPTAPPSQAPLPLPAHAQPTDDVIEAIIQQATSARATPDGRPLRDTRTQLFVGNLPYRVRWQDLKDLFRRAGTVLRADVSLGPDNRSRGYGTVLLASAEDAGRAVDMFNGYEWQTRVLEVRLDRMGVEFGADGSIGSAMAGGGTVGPNMGMAGGITGGGMQGRPQIHVSQGHAAGSSSSLGGAYNLGVGDEEQLAALYNAQGQGQGQGQAHDQTPCKNLFIGNLPFHTQWQDLKDLFRQAGTVVRADVALGPDGRSRGFGTVSYTNEVDAARAVRMFHGHDYNGRVLKVHFDKFTNAGQPEAPVGLGPSVNVNHALASSILGNPYASANQQRSASAAMLAQQQNPSSSQALGGAGSPASLQQMQSKLAPGFMYDFGSASGPSSPYDLYTQLQRHLHAQQGQQPPQQGQQGQSMLKQHQSGYQQGSSASSPAPPLQQQPSFLSQQHQLRLQEHSAMKQNPQQQPTRQSLLHAQSQPYIQSRPSLLQQQRRMFGGSQNTSSLSMSSPPSGTVSVPAAASSARSGTFDVDALTSSLSASGLSSLNERFTPSSSTSSSASSLPAPLPLTHQQLYAQGIGAKGISISSSSGGSATSASPSISGSFSSTSESADASADASVSSLPRLLHVQSLSGSDVRQGLGHSRRLSQGREMQSQSQPLSTAHSLATSPVLEQARALRLGQHYSSSPSPAPSSSSGSSHSRSSHRSQQHSQKGSPQQPPAPFRHRYVRPQQHQQQQQQQQQSRAHPHPGPIALPPPPPAGAIFPQMVPMPMISPHTPHPMNAHTPVAFAVPAGSPLHHPGYYVYQTTQYQQQPQPGVAGGEGVPGSGSVPATPHGLPPMTPSMPMFSFIPPEHQMQQMQQYYQGYQTQPYQAPHDPSQQREQEQVQQQPQERLVASPERASPSSSKGSKSSRRGSEASGSGSRPRSTSKSSKPGSSASASSGSSSTVSGEAPALGPDGKKQEPPPQRRPAQGTRFRPPEAFVVPLPSPGSYMMPHPIFAQSPGFAYSPHSPSYHPMYATPAHPPPQLPGAPPVAVPMRLNLASVHGAFSPGVAMSPGTFYGRPGEVPNPNPFINAAVGAPVHNVQSGPPSHSPGMPMSHGAYFYAMSSPQKPPTGNEPQGYFDPKYFPPAHTHQVPSGLANEILKDPSRVVDHSDEDSSGTGSSIPTDNTSHSSSSRDRSTSSPATNPTSYHGTEGSQQNSPAPEFDEGATISRTHSVGHAPKSATAAQGFVLSDQELKRPLYRAGSDPASRRRDYGAVVEEAGPEVDAGETFASVARP